MKSGRLRLWGALLLTGLTVSVGTGSAVAQAKFASGKLSGVVRDSAGIPQMGASVEVIPESSARAIAQELLTNTQGIFRGVALVPGFYTVRVTLAGFLPTLEKHIRISSSLTTVVRIQMESMFASIDQLRRQPSGTVVEADEWKWVLRSAPSIRPVLEWRDSQEQVISAVSIEAPRRGHSRARLEFTGGARQPSSASNIASAPATALAYDQKLPGSGRVIFAGQVSHNGDAPSGGFATVWLPSGTLGKGPHTTLVLREAKIGPDGGLTFRGMRINQGGSIALGDRLNLRYGSEYVLVGLGTAASSVRPRAELDFKLSSEWKAALLFASLPIGSSALEGEGGDNREELVAALNELDSFPALLWKAGRPVLQNGWHEELAAERSLGPGGKLQVAAFHDDSRHIAVYGRGNGLPAADFFHDYFSIGFAYDGGSSSSWGTRVALQEKLTKDVELTAIYAFGGALAPSADLDDFLRDVLHTVARHSLGARISGKVPRVGTRMDASYKWVSGAAVSRVDLYGESVFQTDPYLHLGLRQPLPKFSLGRWEAIADCDNLLAQGYVPLGSRDGRLVLVPAFRTFRGGLSVQF